MAISTDLQSLLEKIQAHLHLTGEFDPTYRPDTVARNEAAQLYLDLTALLSTPTQTTKTVGGWHWKSVFHGEVINSGFELGSAKPEFRDSVPGVTFEYTPYYTESCEPEAQENAPFSHPIAEISWTNAQPEWQLRMLVEPVWPDDTPLRLYQHPNPQTCTELLTAWKTIEESLQGTFVEANRAISNQQKIKVRKLLQEFRALLNQHP